MLILAGAPIGQVGDASPRLREALGTAHVIAAEDTRRLKRLVAEGNLRRHPFGIHDDLLLGAEIGGLLAEAEVGASSAATAGVAQGSCAVGDGCRPIVGE